MTKRQCPECKLSLPASDQVPETCTRCGADLSALHEVQDWMPVARVANLAEAGFMADYLAAREIESDITQENEFNAAAGAWQSLFIVRVIQSEAKSAHAILTTGEYSEEESLPNEGWDDLPTRDGASFSAQAFKLMLLLLIVAGVSYFVVNFQRNKPQQDEPESFQQFLTRQPGPWIHHDESGVRSELYYNASRDHLILKQDLDGDKVPEYQRTFQTR